MRSTTSNPFRQLPHAAHATSAGNAAAATKFASHLQSAAPVMQNVAPSRALDMRRKPTPRCRKRCACDEICMPSPECCACHAKRGPQPRARQRPIPLDFRQALPTPRAPRPEMPRNLQGLSRKMGRPATRSTTSKHQVHLEAPHPHAPPPPVPSDGCRMLHAPAPKFSRHLQSAAPVTPQPRA